jgi:hypothetical protein
MAQYLINEINTSPPSGSLTGYLGSSDPDGWVIADGVARTNNSVYDNLVTMGIGTRSGSNYTPPNYRGAFLRGLGTSSVNTIYTGPALNTSQTDEIRTHGHTINDPAHTHTLRTFLGIAGGSGNTSRSVGLEQSPLASTGTVTTGITINHSGSETRPFNFGVNWIIKL